MIAITDVTAFDVEIQPINTNLTTGLLDEHIMGSVIINTTITLAVKNLLKSIITNTGTLQINSTVNKLASYAGFSVNAQGVVSFKSSNISLDRLTFYTIFRLPFASTVLEYQNPLPISNILPSGIVRGWGKYANYIRSISGSGLKQLNEAGVDFDLNDDYFTTLNGYNSVNGIYDRDGLAEYQTALFSHNQEYNKLPISFFRLVQDENPYLNLYKKGNYRKPHWPDKVKDNNNIDYASDRVYFEREIEGYRVGPNDIRIDITNKDIGILYLERFLTSAVDGYYSIQVNNKTYKFRLSDTEDSYFKLSNCELIFYDINNQEVSTNHTSTFKIIARKFDPSNNAMPMSRIKGVYTDNRKYFIELYKSATSGSGITFGAGVDIGAGFIGKHERHIAYQISFTNSVSGFKLGLGRNTVSLNYTTADMSVSIKYAINTLISTHLTKEGYKRMKECSLKSAFIDVVKVGNTSVYNIIIAAPKAFLEPNGLFSPTNLVQISDKTDTGEVRECFKDTWITIKTIFLKSFDIAIPNFPNKEAKFNWLDDNMTCYTLAGITNEQERNEFQKSIKNLVGVKGAMSWSNFRNHFFLIRKFEFGIGDEYVSHLRALYNEYYLSTYYNQAFLVKKFRDKIKIGSSISPSPSQVKLRFNEVEKYVLVSCQYNMGGIGAVPFDLMAKAVNSHDPEILKQVVNKLGWAGRPAGPTNQRAKDINSFIDKCKNKLYHNVV